jgi:plasmid stabilization system protein ParE
VKFRVIIQPAAHADIAEAAGWLAARAPGPAAKWLAGMREAIASLTTHPLRCPLAPESDEFEEEIRELLHGKRGGIYRILFTVSGDTVHLLHVRHAARRPLRHDDEEPSAA